MHDHNEQHNCVSFPRPELRVLLHVFLTITRSTFSLVIVQVHYSLKGPSPCLEITSSNSGIASSVLVSEASFCGGKTNGNYQAPSNCQGYIACSNGVTSHVACPEGKKFDAVKRICEPTDRAVCKVRIPSNTSKLWKMVAIV